MTSNTPGSTVFVKNSVITQNAGGVNVQGNGVAAVGSISNTLIDRNTTFAVQASGAGNSIGLVRSILTGSPTGLSLVGGGTVASFGPSNIIAGAGTISSSPAFK